MRIWHAILSVFLTALLLTVAREPAGRVAIVVFFCGAGELACGTAAVMALFQAVGSIGEARGALEHAQCLLATGIVVLVGSGLMLSILSFCVTMVQVVV